MVVVVAVFLFPLFREPLDETVSDATVTLAYVVIALGLNIVVGFAGLLDLGYVAFFAFGALVSGWLASDHFTGIGGDSGIDFGVSEFAASLPGIHLNFLLLVIGAILVCAIVGAIIGLPTLRLRGDYIAIVTLAFGEIIGRVAQNGDELNDRRLRVLERPRVDLADRPAELPDRRRVRLGHQRAPLLLGCCSRSCSSCCS